MRKIEGSDLGWEEQFVHALNKSMKNLVLVSEIMASGELGRVSEQQLELERAHPPARELREGLPDHARIVLDGISRHAARLIAILEAHKIDDDDVQRWLAE